MVNLVLTAVTRYGLFLEPLLSHHNAYQQFPPASTEEGGNSTIGNFRSIINCIPASQNSYQGGVLSGMIRGSKITKGQKFVLSISCDKVSGSTVPRNMNLFDVKGIDASSHRLGKREVIDFRGTSGPGICPMYHLQKGSDNRHRGHVPSGGGTWRINERSHHWFGRSGTRKVCGLHSIFILPAHLTFISYRVEFKIETGFVEPGGLIIDNLGDELNE